jgi:uncharacterized protein (DUF2252 family)
MNLSVKARIDEFNKGRDPKKLIYKYNAMKANPFAFFRGTCHLFYEDLPKAGIFYNAPLVWITGDTHLQNFGVYKSTDRLIYFDLNDFDESALAPSSWDIARFLTSIYLVSELLKISTDQAELVIEYFLSHYTQAIALGKAKGVEAKTADQITQDLFKQVKNRSRADFLDKRTKKEGKERRFKLTSKILAIEKARKAALKVFLEQWGAQQPRPKFFNVQDVAAHLTGLGSIGIDRYIFLVEGKGSPNNNFLLDLKEATVSSLKPYVFTPQPTWDSQAQRIIAIQTRMQYEVPALLFPLTFEGKSFVLRELQPREDKVNFEDRTMDTPHFTELIKTMARVLASAQIRSSGREGSAIADELIAYGTDSDWRSPLINYARDYAKQVRADYHAFCEAF